MILILQQVDISKGGTMENFLEKIEPFAIEIRKSVMNDLKPRVAHLVDAGWPEVLQAVRDYEISFEKTNAWRVEDEKGAIHLKTGCTILAIYRALEPYFEDKRKLLDVMKEMIDQVAFGEGGENFLINRYGLDPQKPSEAWDRFCSNFCNYSAKKYKFRSKKYLTGFFLQNLKIKFYTKL